MPAPEALATDPRPAQAPAAPAPPPAAPVTQSDLAAHDGAGIRGDYGDASQTNGLEGGASLNEE